MSQELWKWNQEVWGPVFASVANKDCRQFGSFLSNLGHFMWVRPDEFLMSTLQIPGLQVTQNCFGGSWWQFWWTGEIVTEKDVEKDVKQAVWDNLHGLSHRVEAAQFSYMLQLSCS